jgi:chromosome segregation ATPase
MTQQVNVERKLRQLDNDVQSIYEMLAAIAGTQTRHGNRLDEMAEQLAAYGEQLAAHGEQLTSHGRRLQEIDTKLDTVIRLLHDERRQS